jgi:hypothetical protein
MSSAKHKAIIKWSRLNLRPAISRGLPNEFDFIFTCDLRAPPDAAILENIGDRLRRECDDVERAIVDGALCIIDER